MKIILSNKQNDDKSYIQINNISVLDESVLNSEATHILCDDFISCFKLEELNQLLSKICTKMRIGCELIISEVDSSLLFKRFYLEEIDLNEMNQILFMGQKRKSILDMDTIQSNLPKHINIISKHYDYNSCSSIIKCKRGV